MRRASAEQTAAVPTFALGSERPRRLHSAARPALQDDIEAELPPEQLAAARAAATEASLEDLVTQALELVG